LTVDRAREELIRVLQTAHAGELAAALAYDGHARSVQSPVERAEIERIRDDELDHRERVRGQLESLGAAPDARRERRMRRVGRAISAFCQVGGWFAPMYGAGRLEAGNIGEYEDAAQLARECGREDLVDDLLHMAEVEWDHERYFRGKVESHWLRHVLRVWPEPPPRATIRGRTPGPP
jgi:rubrerythrin